MKFNNSLLALLTVFLLGFESICQNVQIGPLGSPSEPSIMMDPENPAIIVAGSNLNFFYSSSDTGRTWNYDVLTSPYGVWGDPVIDVDTAGNFYYFHLSNPPSGSGNWIDRIVCQRSTDSGSTWSSGTFTGLNGTKAQDKQWTIIDRTDNSIYMTWTQFDEYGSTLPGDSSIILFSKSIDNGNTWSTPKRINIVAGDCIDSDSTVEGATPAIGPNGELYVAWAGPNGIVFNRSLDQGDTWLPNEILIDSMPTGWDYAIPGIFRANGLPVLKCDLSGGPNHGTIYVNWSDQRNGPDDTDIWLAKSTDGGNTWSSPIRVNDDPPGKHQFFTWMDIDQTTGNLYFVYYDRRNHSNNYTDVYLAETEDGGTNFKNVMISDSAFLPHPWVFFGDYTNITVHDKIIRPIWARMDLGQLSIWTDITPYNKLLSEDSAKERAQQAEIKQYPNPTTNRSYVSFKLHETSTINLEVYNDLGQKMQTIIDNEKMDYGKYIIPIELDELNFSPGTYYFKLSINGVHKTMQTIVID